MADIRSVSKVHRIITQGSSVRVQTIIKNHVVKISNSSAQGATGADGKTILSGIVDPVPTDGVTGDFWINTLSWQIFGPKAGGVWPTGVDLIGADGVNGLSVLNGTVDPTTEGVNGEFYINTTSYDIFGPKAAGLWGAGTSLIGPQGVQGDQGPAGPGVPTGGTINQVLKKLSATDFDTGWGNETGDVTSVNGQTGIVVLDTDDIAEGTVNFYYTESRVNANTNVAANTSARHSHSNKTQLDLVTDGDHDIRTDNPHGVTIAQAGGIRIDQVTNAPSADTAVDFSNAEPTFGNLVSLTEQLSTDTRIQVGSTSTQAGDVSIVGMGKGTIQYSEVWPILTGSAPTGWHFDDNASFAGNLYAQQSILLNEAGAFGESSLLMGTSVGGVGPTPEIRFDNVIKEFFFNFPANVTFLKAASGPITISSETIFDDNIKASDIYINFDGTQADGTIFFANSGGGAGQWLKYTDANDWFEMNKGLNVTGNFIRCTGGPLVVDHATLPTVSFDSGVLSKDLSYNVANSRFEFDDALYTPGSITTPSSLNGDTLFVVNATVEDDLTTTNVIANGLITVNADGGGTFSRIRFHNGTDVTTAYMEYDHTFTQFNFQPGPSGGVNFGGQWASFSAWDAYLNADSVGGGTDNTTLFFGHDGAFNSYLRYNVTSDVFELTDPLEIDGSLTVAGMVDIGNTTADPYVRVDAVRRGTLRITNEFGTAYPSDSQGAWIELDREASKWGWNLNAGGGGLASKILYLNNVIVTVQDNKDLQFGGQSSASIRMMNGGGVDDGYLNFRTHNNGAAEMTGVVACTDKGTSPSAITNGPYAETRFRVYPDTTNEDICIESYHDGTDGHYTTRTGDLNLTPASGSVIRANTDLDMGTNQVVGLEEAIEIIIDGGGAVISTGIVGDIVAKTNMTITGWTLLADQSGSVTVDVWKDSYANYPPVDADSLVTPSITSAVKNQATGLSLGVTKGDVLRFNVDSAATVERVTLALTGVRA